jgi:hypothetical protein
MDAVPHAAQLAFDFGQAEPDELAERLIAGGFVANAYLLGVNRNLQNPNPLPVPSRPEWWGSTNSTADAAICPVGGTLST